MSRPKAYEPEQGYKYQILCRNQAYDGREWQHCDYATTTKDKNYLIGEYCLAYGAGYEFKSIMLPEKYWKAVI